MAYFTYLRSCIGPGIPHALTSGAISEKEPHKKKVGLEVLFRIFWHGIGSRVFNRGSGRCLVFDLCRT